jgi:hypothetical protein
MKNVKQKLTSETESVKFELCKIHGIHDAYKDFMDFEYKLQEKIIEKLE